MKVKDEVVLVVTTGWMTHHSGLLKLCQARAEFASLAIANRILERFRPVTTRRGA